MIDFFVPGIPAPGGSKRGFLHKHTGRVIVTEDCKRSKDWRATVAMAAAEACQKPLIGPVTASFSFTFPRPKAHYKSNGSLKPSAPVWHTKRPDATKVLRSTEDALKGIAWLDDSQVVNQAASKCFGERPGCRICIWEAGSK